MQPRSLAWDAALGTSHGVTSRVEVWYGGSPLGELVVESGSIRVDRGNAQRRQLDVVVPDPALLPRQPTDLLAPYGVQLRVYRGVVFAGDQVEWMPVGVYRLEEPEGELGLGAVHLTARSLEIVLAERRFTSPRSSAEMGTAVAAITSLIIEGLPGAIVMTRATHDRAIPTIIWDTRTTAWEAIEQLARAIGAEVYPDATGTWVVRDTPDVATDAPVWEVRAGPGGTMLRATMRMSRDGIRNAILATGSNTASGDEPVSGWAVDDDPRSPTWVFGPFGRVDGFYSSPLLTTDDECTLAARSVLLDRRGPNRSADVDIIPNPALEAGDCILFTYADGSRELGLVESFAVPLNADGGSSTLAIRSQVDAPEGLA